MPSSCEALRFSGRCFSLYSFIGMNLLPVPLCASIAVPSPARPARVVRRPLSTFTDGWVLLALVPVLLADVALVLAVLHADVLALLLLADELVLAAGRRSE